MSSVAGNIGKIFWFLIKVIFVYVPIFLFYYWMIEAIRYVHF